MQTYFAEYTLKWNPFALHFYEAVIRNHITPALGKMKLQALNTVQIQTFVNSFCRPVMQRRQSTLVQNCKERLWCSASRSGSAGNRLGTPFAVPTSTASTVPHTRRRQLLQNRQRMTAGVSSKEAIVVTKIRFFAVIAKTALYLSIKCGNLAESQGFELPKSRFL